MLRGADCDVNFMTGPVMPMASDPCVTGRQAQLAQLVEARVRAASFGGQPLAHSSERGAMRIDRRSGSSSGSRSAT